MVAMATNGIERSERKDRSTTINILVIEVCAK